MKNTKQNNHHHTPEKQTRSMNRKLTEKETQMAILRRNLTADQVNANWNHKIMTSHPLNLRILGFTKCW